MSAIERFDEYMDYLSGGLGHLDRHAGLKGYCTGLMLPLARKSVEPMAARVDPLYASARHQVSGIRYQALHQFVAKAEHRTPRACRSQGLRLPRGSPARAAARNPLDRDTATKPGLRAHRSSRIMSLSQPSKRQRKAALATQGD